MIDYPQAPSMDYQGVQKSYYDRDIQINRRMEYKQRIISSVALTEAGGLSHQTSSLGNESYDSLIGEKVPGLSKLKSRLLINQE
jgi:predicted transcriptional regulator